jgi:hypothetical protein
MKRLLALLCLLVAFPLVAQPSRYSFATQVRPGFGTPLSAEATVNLLGDTYYALNATTFARLAGNITTTNKFKCQVGTGIVSAAPGWCALVSGDIPNNAASTSGTAAISTAATITNDATTAATMYPLWATANSGNLPLKTSSTKFSFRPDTGIVTATGFAGPLTGAVTGNASTASSAAKWTSARNIAGNSVDGSANATFANKFLLQGTTDTGMTGAQFMGALGTGIVKNTVTTGVQSIAIAADFPTLNQSTSGSAATLTTPRAINGVNFDGSAAITATADANTLSGTTLHSTVVNSSLTSVGTLNTNLNVYGTIRATYQDNPALTAGVGLELKWTGTESGLLSYDRSAAARRPLAFDASFFHFDTGNVGIGTTVFGTSSAGILGLGNGTAPTSSPASMVQLWSEVVSSTQELRVRDGAGNVTTLSPHNFSMFTPDPSQVFPWSYYSKNAHIGKEMSVDMYGAVAEIEKLSGKQFIYLADLPADQIESWDAQEATNKTTIEQQRLDKALAAEVEVVVADAVEVVTITKTQTSATETESVTKYVLDAESGQPSIVVKTQPKMVQVDTGKTEFRLKVGVRLDEKTGKFWRKIRADEAVVEPYVVKAPPAWMKDRMRVAVR